MKKRYVVAGIMLLAAVLLVMPMQAKAEMYVEAYLGGVFGSSGTNDISGTATRGGAFGAWDFTPSGAIDPAFQGGLKVGTWFVKEGVLGYNYPDWMKYLGFYLDFSYHRLDYRRQTGTWANVGALPFNDNFFSEGYAATLAFMFAARYGFLPDSEVPFGRLQPYLAVGPAILFSGQRPSFYQVSPAAAWALKGPSQSSTDICLAVEAGIRYMALKNVSVEVSYKFRYANPTYNYSGLGDNNAPPFIYSFSYSPNYYLHSVQVGAAYHF